MAKGYLIKSILNVNKTEWNCNFKDIKLFHTSSVFPNYKIPLKLTQNQQDSVVRMLFFLPLCFILLTLSPLAIECQTPVANTNQLNNLVRARLPS